MGAIISPDKTIDSLRFTNTRVGRVAKATRFLRLDKSTGLIELESGGYTLTGHGAHLNGNCAIVNFGSSGPSTAVLNGLVQIGAITKEARKGHMDHVKARTKASKADNAAYRMLEAAIELGIDQEKLHGFIPEGVTPRRRYF